MSAAAAAARDAVANAASTPPAGLWETGRSGSGASSAGGGGGGSPAGGDPHLARAGSSPFPAGLRVLVVDDDPCCLKVVEAMLRRCVWRSACVRVEGGGGSRARPWLGGEEKEGAGPREREAPAAGRPFLGAAGAPGTQARPTSHHDYDYG